MPQEKLDKQYIENVTIGLIKNFNIAYPLDLKPLLDKKKISVFLTDANKLKKDNISGLVRKLKEGYEIYLMKDQPKTRMIFTFAHELGHIILDHFKETDVLIDELHRDNETFFGGFSRSDKIENNQILEKEANYFASCILMPREQVKKQRNTYKDVDKVASFFKVGKEAMTYRLIELGLFKLY